MRAFGNILIFHPAAIGDAMLATPVATTLKLNFPAARITYWSHASLRPLILGLCPSVDEYVDYIKDLSYFEQLRIFKRIHPDLFVDLSNSGRGLFLSAFTKGKVVRYEKQRGGGDLMHAVDNFLAAVQPLCNEEPPMVFPTIYPEAIVHDIVDPLLQEANLQALPMVGIVPGVGKLRPHRAWIPDGWRYLLQHVLTWETHLPVLIGGEDDMELCEELNVSSGRKCLNVCGKLPLDHTAAVLKGCRIVVSGDTGPAHLAVAVGTPVIGLYGATYPERSGPYGCSEMLIDQSDSCKCHGAKFCQLKPPTAPGECMSRIMLTEVIDKLRVYLLGERLDVLAP